MFKEIGSFNAKARLSELLQAVKRGQRFTITLRGRPVADLVPSGSAVAPADVLTAVENMQKIHKISGVSMETIREWVTEGRK
ncbi:MAG: type II toxin-antitoxin system prevent-host-death family antitoxin [Proteobacteria bacterium]|nr:type II toxin-antitoxin system prevent-host-death family antitoxin [Pseudomonadota bacterium]